MPAMESPEVPTPEAQPSRVPTSGAGTSGPRPRSFADEGLEEILRRSQSRGLPQQRREARSLSAVVNQAHQTLDEVAEAFWREWELLGEERTRLSDWQRGLEALTKVKKSEVAKAQATLELERESYRRDLKRVFDRELEASQREKRLAAREEQVAKWIAEEEARLETERGRLEDRRVQLDDKESRQSATERRLQEAEKTLQERETRAKTLESELSRLRETLETRERWVKGKETELAEQAEELKADRLLADQQMQEVSQQAAEALQEE